METIKKGIGCCDRSLFSFFQKEKLPYNQNFNLVMRQLPCSFTALPLRFRDFRGAWLGV